jgi:Mg-chelatase subunit ChlI
MRSERIELCGSRRKCQEERIIIQELEHQNSKMETGYKTEANCPEEEEAEEAERAEEEEKGKEEDHEDEAQAETEEEEEEDARLGVRCCFHSLSFTSSTTSFSKTTAGAGKD